MELNSGDEFGSFTAKPGSGEAGTIVPDAAIGKGFIQRAAPAYGLSLRAYDLVLRQDIELQRHRTDGSRGDSYNLTYIISYESCYLRSIGKHEQYVRPASKNSLALSHDVEVSFLASAHQPVQILVIGVSADWLKEYFFSKNPVIAEAWQKTALLRSPLIVLDICTASVNLNVNELYSGILNNDMQDESAHALCFELISSFLHGFLNLRTRDLEAAKSIYREKIGEVEALLMAHLLKPLPSLEEIARAVAMSESTLKRHFKAVRGKGIYEYYLEKKMGLAKDMLMEHAVHVNEVAEKLGYENVSNFIHIFKKVHGFSPGSVKKKG
jgi:AraC-like DNA-binding protein